MSRQQSARDDGRTFRPSSRVVCFFKSPLSNLNGLHIAAERGFEAKRESPQSALRLRVLGRGAKSTPLSMQPPQRDSR